MVCVLCILAKNNDFEQETFVCEVGIPLQNQSPSQTSSPVQTAALIITQTYYDGLLNFGAKYLVFCPIFCLIVWGRLYNLRLSVCDLSYSCSFYSNFKNFCIVV